MKKDRSNKKTPVKRWEHFRELRVHFPEPPEPVQEQGTRPPEPYAPTVAITSGSYPMLRIWLRDRGLPFKPTYGQGAVAMIIGKSDKTVRSRTKRGQMPFHCWPWGEVYYTAQDLEDLLTGWQPGKERVN
jgi:hypothetical protein